MGSRALAKCAMEREDVGDVNSSDEEGGSAINRRRRQWLVRKIVAPLITFSFTGMAIPLMVCSLNLQGYIACPSMKPRGMERLWSPLQVGSISKFAAPGALFDPSGEGDYIFRGHIVWLPIMLHIIGTYLLNTHVVRPFAEMVADWEDWENEYERKLAIARRIALLDGVNFFMAPAYIAFWQLDVGQLRAELFGMYSMDTVRRIIFEVILPRAQAEFKNWHGHRSGKEDGPRRNVSDCPRRKISDMFAFNSKTLSLEKVQSQLDRPEYEPYDDYLEVTIDFAKVVLFAAACPVSSSLSFVCLLIEAHSDAVKLPWSYRRPRSCRAADFGIWQGLILQTAWVSVATNSLIFGFTTCQVQTVQQHLPEWMHVDPWIEETRGSERQHGPQPHRALGAVFAFEHVLMLLGPVLAVLLVPRVPAWVSRRAGRYRRRVFAAASLPTSNFANEDFTSSVALGAPSFHRTKTGTRSVQVSVVE